MAQARTGVPRLTPGTEHGFVSLRMCHDSTEMIHKILLNIMEGHQYGTPGAVYQWGEKTTLSSGSVVVIHEQVRPADLGQYMQDLAATCAESVVECTRSDAGPDAQLGSVPMLRLQPVKNARTGERGVVVGVIMLNNLRKNHWGRGGHEILLICPVQYLTRVAPSEITTDRYSLPFPSDHHPDVVRAQVHSLKRIGLPKTYPRMFCTDPTSELIPCHV